MAGGLLPQQGPEPAAQGHVLVAFGALQAGRPHSLSGLPTRTAMCVMLNGAALCLV